MTAQQENNPSTNQEVAERQAAADQKTGQQLAEELLRMAAKAAEAKRAVEEAVRNNKNATDVLTGSKQDKDSLKGKANDFKQALQEALLAAKGGKVVSTDTQTITPKNEFAQSALRQIAEKIGVGTLSDESALQLGEFVSKIVDGTVKDVDGLKQEFNKIKNLKTSSSPLYEKVQQALVKTAQEKGGLGEQEAQQKFDVAPTPTPEQPTQTTEDAPKKTEDTSTDERLRAIENRLTGGNRDPFEDMWGQYFADYLHPGDKNFVKAIFDPEMFKAYINGDGGLKDQVAQKLGMEKNSKEVRMKVSKDMENNIVELFGKLYTRLDHERAGEFFEQIEQQDIMRGILPAKNILKRRLSVLAAELHHGDDLGLYRDGEMAPVTEDIPFKDKEGKTKMKPRLIISPYPKPTETSASQYIHYLDQKIDTYIEARKYTHNARAIFLHPVDHEKGFYAQLAQFAEQMTTVDFDQMFLLPDADIFQSALTLYDKHVDEMFAKNDWRHAPTMFQPESGGIRSQLEIQVLKQLKQMYGAEGVSDARLDAAVTMAVGASRGMFLTEIEKSALADPHVNEDGSITYASYYNNDTSALNALNPMHTFFRFQGTRSTDPILFMPVEGDGFKGSIFSDHNDLYKKMQGYKDSFLNSRTGKNSDLKEGEVLFADYLVNIGKVGGPLQRRGWRTTYMFQPLYYKDKAGISEGKQTVEIFDFVKTWKRFENIGYEVVQDLVTKMSPGPNPGSGEFPKAREGAHGLANERYVAQKKELFDYLYTRYFNKTADGDVNHYLKGIRNEMEKKVWEAIKAGKPAPIDVDAEIESKTTMEFLNRTLSRLVAQRIPSKILRIDRDRLSVDGTSRWRKIAEEMFSFKDVGDQQSEKFDAVVKDLMFAEQLLRTKVSDEMRKIKGLPESEHYRFGEVPYELTQEVVTELLRGKGFSDEQIKNACTLLGKIESHYMQGKEGIKFLDTTLLNNVKAGGAVDKDYKFTFGLEELDMSFIPWRAGGNRMLPRAIGDISTVEKNVAGEIIKLPGVLNQIAIDGKHDFSPVLEICEKVYKAMEGIIAPDYAHRLVHHIAALTIQYYKKDTKARWAYGLFGLGKKCSLAAERAGGFSRVWEWDSTDIDRFCVALESRSILPREPYNPSNPKPGFTPIYINVPFINRAVKLPDSFKFKWGGKEKTISLFKKRKPDFEWSIKNLRDKFGGNWKDIGFDYINKYLPLIMAWLIWKYIQDAQKEAEGKKK